ncbi:hypothetical protein [Neobacillus bataviensis]|uniref:hypothetical protein n=1 Tax=Neobacillus bataviensis TaxID=220685 RepID=UPI001CBF553B|nr:hypothetical protein [Neobacillus bataviensis]
MFNEYSVFQMMKFRQEEIERNAKEAWKFYDLAEQNQLKELSQQTTPSLKPCCQCS